ncbi:hypothetical protein SAMN05421831_10655 [Allopseudospirillum japonicum]|uniref:MotA/TolQ/ExbB proton channel family protein n=1 Tax=Allopseudospirillum japonicum TaxID=64971 RepID=A0A1H6SDW6_9GAMM|nr:hypothetical protein [Allopseudospirillum japonicum]SEI64144.1 hypothetical protein SAMN05421831_10655 [Allopseudospirillum japonicum]
MISYYLEWALSALNVSSITDFFVILLLTVCVISIVFKKKGIHVHFTQYVPTLLTTLGILGTFFGIVIGLLGFDVTNIDGSIEALLGGMKTAFLTSLVGMLLSVAYKVLVSTEMLTSGNNDGMDADQIGAAEIYVVLQEQRDNAKSAYEQHAESLKALQDAVGSGDESSLTGQIKLLRSDVNDANKNQLSALKQLTKAIGGDDKSSVTGQIRLLHSNIVSLHKIQRQEFTEFQSKLWAQLQEFAEMMSKSATEAVIEALRDVITDFNNNLTEQFGENFKELNQAVENLVQWQENYKQQIEEMTRQYALGVTAISNTETAVASIQQNTQQIPQSMEKLSEVIQVNQHQVDELARHLEAFKDVRDKAVEALPQLKEQISLTVASVDGASVQLTEGLSKSGELMQERIKESAATLADKAAEANKALKEASETVHQSTEKTSELLRNITSEITEHSRSVGNTLKESGKALQDEAARSREQFESGLESMRDQLNSTLELMSEQQAAKVQGLIAGLKEAMEESIRESAKAADGSIEILDKAMQTEINRVMEQMGQALVSVTGKFTEDYQALVAQMQRVVRTQAEV